MCGIIGITSGHPVAGEIMAGLNRLAYRGYDSAGIAVVDAAGELVRRRAAGKIQALEGVLANSPIDGVVGIGHTRWATHGHPTDENAHPHAKPGVALVHNGIIENHAPLREQLRGKGMNFDSETDTEVVAGLMSQALSQGQSPREAFASTLSQLRGAFAICAIFEAEPDTIYGARAGAPLVVGTGEGRMAFGSDALALTGLSDHLIYLADGDWAIVSPKTVEILDRNGHAVLRPSKIPPSVAQPVDRGGYRHFMEKEIHEEPDAVRRTIAAQLDDTHQNIKPLNGMDWASSERVIAASCGSAHIATMVARYWFNAYAKLPLHTEVASEFRYMEPVTLAGDRGLFVSQSGETADTMAAHEYTSEQGVKTLALLNVADSSLDRASDVSIFTHAGPEIAVASTKAFVAQLAALAGLAIGAGRARGTLTDVQSEELTRALLQAPTWIDQAISLEDQLLPICRHLAQATQVLFLGRSVFYPLALEGALKFKEINYINAEGYAGGELKHGPIALIEEGSPVVAMAPDGPLFEKMMSNLTEVRARGAKLILLTDNREAKAQLGPNDEVILVPTCPEIAQPLVYSAPLHLLAYNTALVKGTDADQPRNLAKSVTVE